VSQLPIIVFSGQSRKRDTMAGYRCRANSEIRHSDFALVLGAGLCLELCERRSWREKQEAPILLVATIFAATLRLVRGIAIKEYLATRDRVSGTVYYAMLVVFAAMPPLVARRP
jgi:hypothetical protein